MNESGKEEVIIRQREEYDNLYGFYHATIDWDNKTGWMESMPFKLEFGTDDSK